MPPRLHIPKSIAVGDYVVIAVCIAVALVALPFLRTQRPDTVVVYHGNSVAAEYPISEDRVFKVMGDIGAVTIRVHDGQAEVLDSRCPQRICVRTAAISHPGQQIVCVPNRVLVTVRSARDKEGLDAIGR